MYNKYGYLCRYEIKRNGNSRNRKVTTTKNKFKKAYRYQSSPPVLTGTSTVYHTMNSAADSPDYLPFSLSVSTKEARLTSLIKEKTNQGLTIFCHLVTE